MAASDEQLLRDFQATGTPELLNELVARNIDLVYSAALRQVRDPHLAQDVSQAVFVLLVQKAVSLKTGTLVTGWLFNAVGFVSANALKMEARRKHHEQQAARPEPMDPPPQWQALAPILDQAMANLGHDDRDALLLRFFKGLSLREVGAAIGTTEEAARKRVDRALQKLRRILGRRGLGISTATLSGLLLSHALLQAPEGLAATVSNLAGSSGAALTGQTLTLVQGAIQIMAYSKLKTVLVTIIVLLFIGGAGVVALQQVLDDGPQSQIIEFASPAGPGGAPSAITGLYSLKPGELLKRVAPPYPVERDLALGGNPQMGGQAPDEATFRWDGQLKRWGMSYGSQRTLAGVLQSVVGLGTFEFEGPDELLKLPMAGDWIIREGAAPEQVLVQLEQLARQQAGRTIRFQKRTVDREVILVTGRFQFKTTPGAQRANAVQLYAGQLDPGQGSGGGSGGFADFFKHTGSLINRRFVDQSDHANQRLVQWANHQSAYLRLSLQPGSIDSMKLNALLDNLSRQMSLTFVREKRPVEIWFVEGN